MKEVNFAATRTLCDERCINIAKLARKHGINKNTMTRYLNGKLDGHSGHGVYGQIENALNMEGLLVLQEPTGTGPKFEYLSHSAIN